MNKKELRDARHSLGLSQTEFGKKIGMSREAISFMERGEREIMHRTELAVRFLLSDACPTERLEEDIERLKDDAVKNKAIMNIAAYKIREICDEFNKEYPQAILDRLED